MDCNPTSQGTLRRQRASNGDGPKIPDGPWVIEPPLAERQRCEAVVLDARRGIVAVVTADDAIHDLVSAIPEMLRVVEHAARFRRGETFDIDLLQEQAEEALVKAKRLMKAGLTAGRWR